MNTIQALQELYLKLGGSLADTYSDIAGGVPVGEYVLIPDMIAACAQIAESGGDGEGGEGGGGGGGGAFVIGVANKTLDKTYAEILAAAQTGVCVVIDTGVEDQAETSYVNQVFSTGADAFTVVCLTSAVGSATVTEYTATSADGYPATT